MLQGNHEVCEFEGIRIELSAIKTVKRVLPGGIWDGLSGHVTVINRSGQDIKWCNVSLFQRSPMRLEDCYSKISTTLSEKPILFVAPIRDNHRAVETADWKENGIFQGKGNSSLPKEIGIYQVYGEYTDSKTFQKIFNPVTFGPSCFPSGTPILTPYGDRKIETFKKGDLVLSWNQNKRAFYERHVKKLVTHGSVPVIEIALDHDIDPILVTPSHNLLTSKGWVQAGHLNSDDALFVVNKQNGLLGLSRVLYASRTADILPVHNLIVEGEHNFVAGGVVAHSFTFARGLRSALHTGVEKTKGFLAGGNQPTPAFVFGG